jgi:CheY-like chemotaxis protein
MKEKIDTVLLVDDDAGTNFLNRMVLEDAEVAKQIQTVLNGKEAIQFLANVEKEELSDPMLILLDINMPVMDGWEFLNAYRELNGKPKRDIIIVMLTTSLNPADKERAESISEIAGFKTKPLSREMLHEILTTYF